MHATPGVAAYMAEVEPGSRAPSRSVPASPRRSPARRSPRAAKRLRPFLCFLTAYGPPPVAAGVAVEMVHMATLVHDDLVDGARLRRGLPAAWSVYGADAAKAAGDHLYARAFSCLR